MRNSDVILIMQQESLFAKLQILQINQQFCSLFEEHFILSIPSYIIQTTLCISAQHRMGGLGIENVQTDTSYLEPDRHVFLLKIISLP